MGNREPSKTLEQEKIGGKGEILARHYAMSGLGATYVHGVSCLNGLD